MFHPPHRVDVKRNHLSTPKSLRVVYSVVLEYLFSGLLHHYRGKRTARREGIGPEVALARSRTR